MSILVPREDRFYSLIEASASNVSKGADMLLAMLRDYTDVTAKAMAIKAVEHAGDQLIHETFEQLNKVFVTPLDREDIGGYRSALDDVIDLIEAAADDFVLMSIEQPQPAALELAQLLVLCAAQVQEAASAACRRSRSIARAFARA